VENRSQLDPVWSPDGNSIIFGRIESREEKLNLQLIDLKTRKLSDIPDSEGRWVPSWSPDGNKLVAVDQTDEILSVLDFKTQKWSELARSTEQIADVHFSHDGKALYYEDFSDNAVRRVPLNGGKVETVLSLKDLRRPDLPYWPPWMGLGPDDSILVMRDIGSQEIYALDWE